MKIIPKEFQEKAVEKLVKQLRSAAREAQTGELQSVCLSSPTGSGKTVMMTAAIEALLQGDDNYPPMPDATFLWITDQPELNEQTRRKMRGTSSVLHDANLVVIQEGSFDEAILRPGMVYFLNTQKLGKDKNLVTPGDDRTYTFWETLRNTVSAKPGKFFCIVDEAHRGMGESTRARNEATTIIQKFIKGSNGEVVPVPLIVGVSATPERFTDLIKGTTRTARSYNVPPEEVRDSGLIKEVITLYHPDSEQPSDVTMLCAAVREWKNFTANWTQYCSTEDVRPVRPVMVVQVQDGVGKQFSKTDIAEVIQVIREEAGETLPAPAFAHAFQEGTRLEFGGSELRYLAPSDIEDDPDVRFVLFKTSLNTGWDCPRAEVMMSFRTALDSTLIAQLVGRMVRTPLARRVKKNEFLNTVGLFLPHYDAEEVAEVVKRLTGDADNMPPVRVEKGEESLPLSRAPKSSSLFDLLSKLPSYQTPSNRKTSEVKRLLKLGRLLAHDAIDDDGPDNAKAVILGVLDSRLNAAKKTKRFSMIVEERGQIEVRAVNWQVGTALVSTDSETIKLDISRENVEDLFEAAGRKLGEGLHKDWWQTQVKKDPTAKERAKLELFALCIEPDALKAVEDKARQAVQKWLQSHAAAINALADARQQLYDEVRRLAGEAELSPLAFPDIIEGKIASVTWERHLYVAGDGTFPQKLNTWETQVVEEELKNKNVVGWLRNPDRKPWSLCVPYNFEGVCKPLYPDFLFVRKQGNNLVVDLLDPHLIELSDAPAKAAGLAQYAAKHAHKFGRIELIIVNDDKQIKRINLQDETLRDKVKAVSTHAHLRQLFDSQ